MTDALRILILGTVITVLILAVGAIGRFDWIESLMRKMQ